MTVTSDQFLLDGKSFVTKTDDNTATVVRTPTGAALTQTEKEVAGSYYNAVLDEIDYAKIYNLDFGADFIGKLGASDEWMAKALTDKTYKDVFKKATELNSPNITFADVVDPNDRWQSTPINRSANNKSTDRGGKFIGRYPLNKDRKKFDFLQVTAKKYKPNSFAGAEGMVQDADDRNMASVGSVYLPMQPGLAESSNVNWGGETLNALEAAAANIAGSTITGAGEGLIEAGMNAGMATKDAFKTIFGEGGVDSKDVAAYFAGQAVGKNVFTRTTGKIMNPNLELLFSGPNLRTFNYNYQFTPREDREAKEIRSIIKFFKKNMAPIRKGKLFLESPNVFKLKYIFKNGGQHPFLNKIKLCALQSFNVQYTPDGSYMTYDDGSMTSYTASMTFQELNPIYSDEIEMSSNDMGF
tara:strand:+ start:183 stop:1418 length:1236 start_codon:yes stop_codon:yes gene_type:complete